ncbi:MAG: class I SAM-dependent methyltransferase [Planctomycetota bacterium]|jgi:hypothetical protein
MDLDTALDFGVGIQQGCDETEHRIWYKLITEDAPGIPGGCIVEVGAHSGGGSTTMAAACDERGFVLECVDSWFTDTVPEQRHCEDWEYGTNGYPYFLRHVDQLRKAGLNEIVTRHVGDCKKIGPKLNLPCVFLWIDGAHGGDHPERDFLAFEHLVVLGGIVGFHDASREGIPGSLRNLEKDGFLRRWAELEGMPLPSCVVPDKEKRISIPMGFDSRFFRRLK